MTLTLTSKSSQFILVPKCTKVVNLVKIPRAVYKMLCSQTLITHAHTDTCTDAQTTQKHNVFSTLLTVVEAQRFVTFKNCTVRHNRSQMCYTSYSKIKAVSYRSAVKLFAPVSGKLTFCNKMVRWPVMPLRRCSLGVFS